MLNNSISTRSDGHQLCRLSDPQV